MERVRFLGLDCVVLQNETVRLLVTESVGPRIISYALPGAENVLAEIPELTLDCPGAGAFHLWGGHRLWHAPEVARRTYLPDDRPVTITPRPNGLHVLQDTQPASGIQKALDIQLSDAGSTVIIDHYLTNHSLWPIECAPWAITQLKPGGVAILPQRTVQADPDGLLPNRSLAFWTYADIQADNVFLDNDQIRIRAQPSDTPFKVGFPNDHGWLAYVHADQLFLKRAVYDPTQAYYDYNSSSQCYCGNAFIELETLGPKTTIQPGQTIAHRESWQLFQDDALRVPDEQLLPAIQRYL